MKNKKLLIVFVILLSWGLFIYSPCIEIFYNIFKFLNDDSGSPNDSVNECPNPYTLEYFLCSSEICASVGELNSEGYSMVVLEAIHKDPKASFIWHNDKDENIGGGEILFDFFPEGFHDVRLDIVKESDTLSDTITFESACRRDFFYYASAKEIPLYQDPNKIVLYFSDEYSQEEIIDSVNSFDWMYFGDPPTSPVLVSFEGLDYESLEYPWLEMVDFISFYFENRYGGIWTPMDNFGVEIKSEANFDWLYEYSQNHYLEVQDYIYSVDLSYRLKSLLSTNLSSLYHSQELYFNENLYYASMDFYWPFGKSFIKPREDSIYFEEINLRGIDLYFESFYSSEQVVESPFILVFENANDWENFWSSFPNSMMGYEFECPSIDFDKFDLVIYVGELISGRCGVTLITKIVSEADQVILKVREPRPQEIGPYHVVSTQYNSVLVEKGYIYGKEVIFERDADCVW